MGPTKKKIYTSPIFKRMTNGIIWSFSGTALAKFLTLIAGIFCARILQKEAYGEFSIVRSTINMFIVLGSAGLGVTSTKYISEYKKNKKEKIPYIYAITNTFGIFTAIITALLIIIGSSFLASNILQHPDITSTIRIGAVLLFFSILNGVQNGTLTGFEDFRTIAINTLVGNIFQSIFMIIGAYFKGINGATLGFGVGFIVIFLTNHISINKIFKTFHLHKIKINKVKTEDLKILYTYSIPAALSALLITPSFWLIRSILVRSDGFKELAIFEAADQWKVIILFIPTSISQIILPILASLQKEKATFITTLKYNLLIVGITSTIIALGIILFSSNIMYFYGNTYSNSLPLKILAISTIFSALANVLEIATYSIGKMWQCFFINIIWASSMIVLTVLLTHKGFGADGLALAILISYILSFIIFLIYTLSIFRKETNNG